MSNIRFKWSDRSFYDLRRDPAVIKELERRGKQIASRANKTLDENRLRNKIRSGRTQSVGYRMSSFQGAKVKQGRWFVQVYTASNHAKHSEAKHNTLIRVLNETQHVQASPLQDYTP